MLPWRFQPAASQTVFVKRLDPVDGEARQQDVLVHQAELSTVLHHPDGYFSFLPSMFNLLLNGGCEGFNEQIKGPEFRAIKTILNKRLSKRKYCTSIHTQRRMQSSWFHSRLNLRPTILTVHD